MITDFLPELNFAFYLILSQLSPGPDQTLVTRTSLLYGFRAGTAVTLGISVGIIFQAIIVVTVGSTLLQGPWAPFFYYFAAAWLLYLAWKIWPKKAILEQGKNAESFQEKPRLLALFKDAMICNMLNPKCTLFLIALSTKIWMVRSGFWYSCFFVGYTVVVGGLSWIVWVVAFQWKPMRDFYSTYMVAIDRIFSLALCLFAFYLLYETF